MLCVRRREVQSHGVGTMVIAGQTGRHEARDFRPGPSTTRHELNGPRHGLGPVGLVPDFVLRPVGWPGTARLALFLKKIIDIFTYFGLY